MTLIAVGKICSKCNEEFPATLEYFDYRKDSKDELRGQCRKCRHQLRRTEQNIISGAAADKRYYSTIKGHLRQVFTNMRKRCYNVNHHNYHRYGGRGIKICFESSDEFIDYVVNTLQINPRGLTIDRIDNDGNYERGNIQFVTNFDNCQNRDNYKYNVKKRSE